MSPLSLFDGGHRALFPHWPSFSKWGDVSDRPYVVTPRANIIGSGDTQGSVLDVVYVTFMPAPALSSAVI